MSETLEDKVARIKKYGIREDEVWNQGEAIYILSAHLEHLNNKISSLWESLERVAYDSFSLEEAKEEARYGLGVVSLREIRNQEEVKNEG